MSYAQETPYSAVDHSNKTVTIRNVVSNPSSGAQTIPGVWPSFPPTAIINGDCVIYHSYEQKFEMLAKSWDRDMFGESVITYQHLSHYQIIGMGQLAIRPLLERLKRGESHWTYALKCITGAQPDLQLPQNTRQAVVEAWIDWGIKHGFTTR